MPLTLKGKIQSLVDTLEKAGKARLADCIRQNWHKTALAYSKELNLWRPKLPIEPELLSAFGAELDRLRTPLTHKEDILASLKRRRVIQTGPHLGATESPRMLCINWLGSLGVPDTGKDFYVVGMFSGIPFSNKSHPGRINKKEGSINLLPSAMQNELVYRSAIPAKMPKVVDSLPIEIARYLPKAVAGESYTTWALTACQHIERSILKKSNLIYLDINEVTTAYLIQVLQKPSHPFYKIFFAPVVRQEFTKAFPDETMFYIPADSAKHERVENMTLAGATLKSKNFEISLQDKTELIDALMSRRLCPALLTSFMAIAFINQFKCFGSFAQVEYLPAYQKKLAALSFMSQYNPDSLPASNLTTGVFPNHADLYPADILGRGTKFKPSEKALVGELLLPMKDVLLESYFTGTERNGHKK